MSSMRMLPSVRVFINLIESLKEHETKTRVDGIHVKICLCRGHQRTVKAIVLISMNKNPIIKNRVYFFRFGHKNNFVVKK